MMSGRDEDGECGPSTAATTTSHGDETPSCVNVDGEEEEGKRRHDDEVGKKDKISRLPCSFCCVLVAV